MGGRDIDLSHIRTDTGPTPDQQAAATRAVLWRYEFGALDADDTLEVLRALGLRPPAPRAAEPLPELTPEQRAAAQRRAGQTP